MLLLIIKPFMKKVIHLKKNIFIKVQSKQRPAVGALSVHK